MARLNYLGFYLTYKGVLSSFIPLDMSHHFNIALEREKVLLKYFFAFLCLCVLYMCAVFSVSLSLSLSLSVYFRTRTQVSYEPVESGPTIFPANIGYRKSRSDDNLR